MESDYIFHIGGSGGHFVSALIGNFVHNDTANVKVTHSNNEYKYFGDKIKARHFLGLLVCLKSIIVCLPLYIPTKSVVPAYSCGKQSITSVPQISCMYHTVQVPNVLKYCA